MLKMINNFNKNFKVINTKECSNWKGLSWA